MKTCGKCKYWKCGSEIYKGECRLNPREYVRNDWEYPKQNSDDYCSFYRKKQINTNLEEDGILKNSIWIDKKYDHKRYYGHFLDEYSYRVADVSHDPSLSEAIIKISNIENEDNTHEIIESKFLEQFKVRDDSPPF